MRKIYQDDEKDQIKEKGKIDDEKNREKEYLTENHSATAFSSEAELKFKKSQLQKIKDAVKKTFLPPQTRPTSKFSDLWERTKWTIFMLVGFILVIAMGNFYCSLLVLLIICLIFSELIDLSIYRERNQEIKNYYLWNWWFFSVCIFYFYIKLIYEKLSNIMLSNKFLAIIYRYHTMISFMLYLLGFLIFLNSLTKGKLRYQFRIFAYNHLILLIFGIQSSLIISNIFNGLIWFILPCSLVICNDISAYIFGRMFGRTPLTNLSPKKTVEGFIGGMFSTIIWCFIFSEMILYAEFFLCPIKDVTIVPFFTPKCDISEFSSKIIFSYDIFGYKIYNDFFKNIHFHTFFMGLFASLLAPLGGFFASGFKRAIKIKDFADTIPGHGGLTDRMDCQILNAVFTYIWTSNFIFHADSSKLNYILSAIVTLTKEDQLMIYEKLKNNLGL